MLNFMDSPLPEEPGYQSYVQEPGFNDSLARQIRDAMVPYARYWLERYPVNPERLERSRMALNGLREGHKEEVNGRRYPWQVSFNPATDLPKLLRTRLSSILADEQATLSDKPEAGLAQVQQILLSPRHAHAIFGEENRFAEEFELIREPIIRFANGENDQYHFAWRQVYQGKPVIGGSLRVHGVIGEDRLAVTSSYFPIEEGFLPAAPAREIDKTNKIKAMKLQIFPVVIAVAPADQQKAMLKALLDELPYQEKKETEDIIWAIFKLKLWEVGNPLFSVLFELNRHSAQFGDQAQMALLVEQVSLTYLAEVENAEIAYSEAILPFNGSYHWIVRYRIGAPNAIPWYVDKDISTEDIIGKPWQPANFAPYYQSSRETRTNGPTGNSQTLDWNALKTYVRLLLPADLAQVPTDVATVAAHTQNIHDYLMKVCGVAPARLQAYNGVTPALEVLVNSPERTHFAYEGALPRKIHFQADTGGGITLAGKAIHQPALDPEVVLHELAHGFLWLINPDAWVMPPPIGPFAHALQEGYAFYLARSIGVFNNPLSETDAWAIAAYRPEPPDNWGDQWHPGRSGNAFQADFLPGPNIYPPASAVPEELEMYNASMIWARALWDLRKLLGFERADKLIVQAFPYLHGYITNFELAVEGILDVDVKTVNNTNLAGGSHPLWALRGILAGQGIRALAQTQSGARYAAGDIGVLRWNGNAWQLENNLAGGAKLVGVNALIAAGDTLYAAATLPPSALSGNQEWQEGVFLLDTTAGNQWQALSKLPENARALSLQVVNGILMVGADRNLYLWDAQTKQWTPPHKADGTSGTRDFPFTALTITQSNASTFAWAMGPTNIWRQRGDPAALTIEWNLVAKGTDKRLNAIAGLQDQCYVGGLAGLSRFWRQNNQWQEQSVSNVNAPVLAMTVDHVPNPPVLYFATSAGVFSLDTANNKAQSVGQIGTGIKVISLLAVNGVVWAGTVADGIWEFRAGDWTPQATLSATQPVALAKGELGLITLALEKDSAQHFQLPQDIELQTVAQPGFPLRIIQKDNANFYTCAKGTVILAVLNKQAAASVTLTSQIVSQNTVSVIPV